MLENLPGHIVWLYEKHRIELTQALQRERLEITAEQAIETMFSADPSQKKGAVDWLVKTYLKQGYLWEDIDAGASSKVYDTLSLFGQNRQKLHGNLKNLAQYSSLANVYGAIKDYVVVKESTRSKKRELRSKILDETKVLYRDERVILSIPLTKDASKWWGKGTQWCTAADKNNCFDHYSSNPLIVLTFPHGLKSTTPSIMSSARRLLAGKKGLGEKDRSEVRKLQLWVNHYNFQSGEQFSFMDETDGPVNRKLVELNWPLMEPVLKWALEINPFVLSIIPDHVKTRDAEFYQKLVSLDGNLILNVPYLSRSKSLCALAVANNGKALEWVPRIYKNYEICMQAVKQTGWALAWVPERMRDEQMCLEAIRTQRGSIQWLPESLRTSEFLLKAIAVNVNVIKNIDRYLLSYEMYRVAVSNGYNIRYIPDEMRSKEICRIAVEQAADAFKFVPEIFRDKEMCRIAVAGEAVNLRFVPQHLKTPELCKQAVEADGWALAYVPENFKTRDICRAAVNQTGYSLRNVPPDIVDQEICWIAVKNNPRALEYVPKEFASDSLAKLALDQLELERELEKNSKENITVDCDPIYKVQGIQVKWNYSVLERLEKEISMSDAYSQKMDGEQTKLHTK